MLFNSFDFIIFFPIVAVVSFIIPGKLRNIWLLLTSYYFYMSWNPKYIVLLLFATVITYFSGLGMDMIARKWEVNKQKRWKKCCVALSVCANLSMLFFFKYMDLAIGYFNRFLSVFNIRIAENIFDYPLPVGISFFTFQSLGYVIDVYRGKVQAEKNPVRYALFIAFFPQLVAGPIERSENLLRQMKETHKFDYDKTKRGLQIMLWGFFLKLVIADRIAIVVNTVYGNIEAYGGCYLIVATILFAFQIYCDFSGYSTIAKGAAMIMGFELMENFKAPYLSLSVSEFWRRWHISLSGWFRDYLYIPLGGNRKGTVRKYINLFIVFSISGLWHGASLSYVLWGMLNGTYQIIGFISRPGREWVGKKFGSRQNSGGHKILSCMFTFLLVDFSWLFFRAGSLGQAFAALKSIFSVYNPWILFDGSLYGLGIERNSFIVMLFAILVLLAVDYLHYHNIHVLTLLAKQELWCRALLTATLFYAVIMLGVYGVDYDVSTFIYFAF
jgi:Predicted membrane protein involved in D-alanine export